MQVIIWNFRRIEESCFEYNVYGHVGQTYELK